MFTFCDVLHEAKQNKKRKQILKSAQYGLEIVFNIYQEILRLTRTEDN